MQLSVTRDIDGESGIVTLSIRDILFLEYDRNVDRVIFNTLDNRFYAMGTLKYWTTTLNSSGYNFVVADRNITVNIDRIVSLNPILRTAYFEVEVRKNSKKCTMALKRYNGLEEKFVSYNPKIVLS